MVGGATVRAPRSSAQWSGFAKERELAEKRGLAGERGLESTCEGG